jgi:hypothetical protein
LSSISDTWLAYLVVAEGLQPNTTPAIPVSPVTGRFIKFLVGRLVKFWGKHKATLIPYLTQLAVAAAEALVANQGSFDNVNPPGPD